MKKYLQGLFPDCRFAYNAWKDYSLAVRMYEHGHLSGSYNMMIEANKSMRRVSENRFEKTRFRITRWLKSLREEVVYTITNN